MRDLRVAECLRTNHQLNECRRLRVDMACHKLPTLSHSALSCLFCQPCDIAGNTGLHVRKRDVAARSPQGT